MLASAAAIAGIPAGSAHAAARPASQPCADGPLTATMVATATRLGVIDLHLLEALDVPVTFYECVRGRAVELGRRTPSPGLATHMYSATTWRCGRRTRRFAATATPKDGVRLVAGRVIRTRSCAQRFELSVPPQVDPGGFARVRVTDRWHVGGVRTKLCVTRPRGRLACHEVIFTSGAPRTRTFRVTTRGRWHVELHVAQRTTRRATIAVGVRASAPRPAPPTVLATGDSTMDGLDGFISDELGDDANVITDAMPGLTISLANEFQPLAVKQVAELSPSLTVVSIGANEGWDMLRPDGVALKCCDSAWVDEYARRVRTTMLTYARRVFWLTVVAPADKRRLPASTAVNTAILQGAAGLPEVHVVRMDLLFTPNGYQATFRDAGRDIPVREDDGIHLNVAGQEIAAREVAKAIRSATGL